MNFLTFLSGIFSGSDNPLSKLIGLIPDVNARAAAQAAFEKEMMELAYTANTAQADIDKTEAASSSVFVAGWRPAIGWVCGAALAWQFVLEPLLSYLIGVASGIWHFTVPALPKLDSTQLYPILMGMLGLGGLRTYEKVQGVARDNLTQPSKPSS